MSTGTWRRGTLRLKAAITLSFLALSMAAAAGPRSGRPKATPIDARSSDVVVTRLPDGPPQRTEANAGWTEVFAEGFEGAFPGVWTLYGSPTWDDETYRPCYDAKSAYCVGSTVAPPGPYPTNVDAEMMAGPFDLSDASAAQWWSPFWLHCEQDVDQLRWWVYDGAAWTGWYITGDYSDSWYQVQLNLTPWCGDDSVWISICFTSDDGDVGGPYEGAYVDGQLVEKRVGPKLAHGVVNAGSSWTWVSLPAGFVDPVIVAGPASNNDSHPGVIRLRYVGSSGFAIRFQEWDYLDGAHPQEKIQWVAVESGNHELEGTKRLVAGKFWTSKTNLNAPRRVMFPQAFSEWPVVLAQVQTNQGASAVTDRIVKVFNGMFAMALQEEEAGGTHSGEQIGYIAISQSVSVIGGVECDAKRSWVKLKSIPAWVGTDMGGTQVFVEEEKSADTEVQHWMAEYGGFLGLAGQPPYVADMQTANQADTCVLRCSGEMPISAGALSAGRLLVSARRADGALLSGVAIRLAGADGASRTVVSGPRPVTRSFHAGNSVALLAPKSVVEGADVYAFERWEVDGMAAPDAGATVQVRVEGARRVVAVYKAAR